MVVNAPVLRWLDYEAAWTGKLLEVETNAKMDLAKGFSLLRDPDQLSLIDQDAQLDSTASQIMSTHRYCRRYPPSVFTTLQFDQSTS